MTTIAESLVALNLRYPDFVKSDYIHWWNILHREPVAGAPARHLLTCSTAKTSVTIRPDGEVVPCSGLAGLTCGNIRLRDFREIWIDSPVLGQLRQLSMTPVDVVDECRDCAYNSLCSGGCRAHAWLATGSLRGYSPYCIRHELLL
jgi:radical SAM protein with 4Fe4S-binding SPASM domain